MKEWKWLESTVELQRDTYGFDIGEQSTGDQATAVKENVLAAIVELVEVLNEVKWKYWAHEMSWVRRAEVLKEMVDVLHFAGNILVSVGVTDDELWTAYREKQEENRRRQQNGYVQRVRDR